MQQYIFDSSSSGLFYEKFDSFHELFVEEILLSAVTPNESNLDSILFCENPSHDALYYEILIAGIQAFSPKFCVKLIANNRLEVECLFYDFGEAEGIQHIYMMQNLMDWTDKSDFCCELWSLKNPDMENLELYWSA
jgi:hypothetical protein